MAKREWTNIQGKEGEIIRLRGGGKTRQEIADIPGLEKGQIKNWVNRHNRKGQGEVAGLRKTRGREPARTLAEYKYENLLNRDFRAERPNSKWVTDISYIHTGQGVLYLSMIRDLYDNSIVAYRIATQQTVNLVLDTIRLAMRKEKKKVASFQQARKLIDEFIYFYNHERIQLKTGVAPLTLRHSA